MRFREGSGRCNIMDPYLTLSLVPLITTAANIKVCFELVVPHVW